MPFFRILGGIAATLLFVPLVAASAQDAGPALEKSADFRVLIDAGGKLASATPLDASLGADVLRSIVGAAKPIAFEPALRDGQPASFESQLHVVVQFVAQPGGGYKVELLSASLSPQSLERKSPVMPRGMDWRKSGAFVVASAVIGADGHVDASRSRVLKSVAAPGSEKELARIEQAALDSLAASRFAPDLVGGKPVATEVLQTFRFCVDDCSKIAEPDLSAERKLLPRIVDADARGARVPASMAARVSGVEAKPLRFRLFVDASGSVTAAAPLGEGEPSLVAATQVGLRGLHFFPASVDGRPVSSEMPVSVPIRVENGNAQPQFQRVSFDLSLLAMPNPRIHLGMRQGEVHARLHVITLPDGRAHASASGVDSIEILPTSSPALARSVEKSLEETIRMIRVEPVQVDGQGVPLEFWRTYYSTICEGPSRCDPPQGEMPPRDPPVKLPAGIELARVKP